MAKVLPVFLPFASCGNRCLYCDQKAVTGREENDDPVSSAKAQISAWLEKSSGWTEAAFYGGNFGAIERGTRMKLYSAAREFGFKNLRFSTRPDTVTDELLNEIENEKINLVELGIQSLSSETLKANGRPYDPSKALRAVEEIASVCACGVQLMVGMYRQTLCSCVDDARRLSEKGAFCARIYPTLVIEGTPLHRLAEKGEYVPASLSDALVAACGMYVHFTAAGTRVIRMGLPFDAEEKGKIVSGPSHRAFGDLVKTLAALLCYESGGRLMFPGYKGTVKKVFSESFPKNCNMDRDDFKAACGRIRSVFLENSERFVKGKAADFAEELCRQAYDG